MVISTTVRVCEWHLKNGEVLKFSIYPFETSWNDCAGLYIFARNQGDIWYPEYIGQALSFRDRLPNHERWQEARLRGTTNVHALAVGWQSDRDRLEKMLIEAFKPALNDHYR